MFVPRSRGTRARELRVHGFRVRGCAALWNDDQTVRRPAHQFRTVIAEIRFAVRRGQTRLAPSLRAATRCACCSRRIQGRCGRSRNAGEADIGRAGRRRSDPDRGRRHGPGTGDRPCRSFGRRENLPLDGRDDAGSSSGWRSRRAAGSNILPPETILLRSRSLCAPRHNAGRAGDSAPGFLGDGIIVFGRLAMGERFSTGLLVHEAREVSSRRAQPRLWAMRTACGGRCRGDHSGPAACFAGAAACATLILAPRDGDPRRFVEAARAVQEGVAGAGLRAGVTAVNGLLIARWLGEPRAVAPRLWRTGLPVCARPRWDCPPRLPRLWHGLMPNE